MRREKAPDVEGRRPAQGEINILESSDLTHTWGEVEFGVPGE